MSNTLRRSGDAETGRRGDGETNSLRVPASPCLPVSSSPTEYLVNYGAEGFFGRFVSVNSLRLRRGDAVVIRGHRGIELGNIVSQATAGHSRFLPNRLVGELLRPATEADELFLSDASGFRFRALEEARRLTAELRVPIEVVDGEALFEPPTFILHYYRTGGGQVRPLVGALAAVLDAAVELHDISLGIATEFGDQENARRCSGGCGSEGGSCGNGKCGGGGGCGSGSCGSKSLPASSGSLILEDSATEWFSVELSSRLPRLAPASDRGDAVGGL